MFNVKYSFWMFRVVKEIVDLFFINLMNNYNGYVWEEMI